MTPERRTSRIARWGVPAGAIAVTGLLVAGFAVSGAQAAPSLPARTPVQLLASISAADQPPPMTAVVQESASLGLPDLPNNPSNPLSALSWLTGSHTFKIWYANPAHVRIAAPVPLGETDVRRDGRNVWLWDSRGNQATHLVLPAGEAGPFAGPHGASQLPSSPDQVARQLLAAVGPTTRVGLQQNVTVAGQAAYQISLAPRDSRSLIGQVRIAVDAKRALPLRVQVFARGGSGPAFQIGYTSLQFTAPAASNFAFTPPPGAKVKTVTVPSSPRALAAGGGPARHQRITAKILRLPKGAPKVVQVFERGTMLKGARVPALPRGAKIGISSKSVAVIRPPHGARPKGTVIQAPAGTAVLSGPGLPPPAPRVFGKDWLTVVAVPAPAEPAAPQTRPRAWARRIGPGGPGGPGLAILGELLRTATPVHGSWGRGRLLTTALVSVLVTSDGEMLIGAVKPAVLYADAAQLR
jgi:outer membrane lipoprotein-sorting protein